MASKSDFPPLRMKVERGHLVPAGPFEAERLESYRPGAIVMVNFTTEKVRPNIKKWWAILGLVMKQCQTPWKTKDEASEAIKLSLGIVSYGKSVHGNFMQWPKSLSDLDEPDLEEAVENMIVLLSRITGVDVSTLKKEAANVGEDETKDAPQPDTEAHAEQPEPSGTEPTPENDFANTQGQIDREMLIECCRKFLIIPADQTIDRAARLRVLVMTKDDWKETLPPENHPALKTIYECTAAQIKADEKVFPALRERDFVNLSALIGCEAREIGG